MLYACADTTEDTEKEPIDTTELIAEDVIEEPEFELVERPLVIDYSKKPEEILVNYTERGMSQLKANFPDTLSMNYALKMLGKDAPELGGKSLSGKEVKLSDLKGNDVLIAFNKTTCSVCKEMVPVVADMKKDR